MEPSTCALQRLVRNRLPAINAGSFVDVRVNAPRLAEICLSSLLPRRPAGRALPKDHRCYRARSSSGDAPLNAIDQNASLERLSEHPAGAGRGCFIVQALVRKSRDDDDGDRDTLFV